MNLQKLELESSILEALINKSFNILGLRYFLEIDHLVMSNWMWLESTSAHNHPKYNKFFSETILKISAALSELTASFEGILIFQITNLKDEKIKDSIQKQIKNIKNSLTDDEFIDSIKNILKFIWRMDLISFLIIVINAEIFNTNRAVKEKAVKTSLTEKQNSLQIRS